ncbi:MAG: ABC-F family ATP-binding cassette domain-containing protein [Defluviitaleaceae bacterium]|nr:ABC-F family ATP-binding cassette domain-containing protein [Defluviitaleaceae bacterium]
MCKSYGEKVLFDHLSLTIDEGDRIGLIGINGTGKSTLLKIIAAQDVPDQGQIYTSKGYTIAYLSQQPDMDEEATVLQQVFSGDNPLIQLQREYEQVLLALEKNPLDESIQNALFTVQQQMDATQAWDANTQIKSMLMKLGMTDLSKQMKYLSGGQRKRVAMASCFAKQPDLLILDEPTNHLDHETIQWLEHYLARYQGSLLFVTHDRYFLDRITNRILELDGGQLHAYTGNYSTFLEAKALREAQAFASEEKRQQLFKRELEWIRRGAKARTTKQKARIDRFEALKEAKGPIEKEQIDMSLSSHRLGKKVLELEQVSKSFEGKKLFENMTYLIGSQGRVGIIGENGSGKSTLLNMMAGLIPPDTGKIERGITVKWAYYTQETEQMDLNQRVIAYIKEVAEVVHTTDGKTLSASGMLERFLFPTFMHGLPLSKLSGGERRRLFLLKLLMGEPNLLFLDEPTNDLDTQTLTILEDYLETFPGVVVTVSHDRYFLDKVVDELIILKGNGQVQLALGAYTDFLEKEKATTSSISEPARKESIVKEKPKPIKKKLSYLEQREWDTIEDDIAKLESQLAIVIADLNETGSDYARAQQLVTEQGQIEAALEEKMDRWEELSELIAGFEA